MSSAGGGTPVQLVVPRSAPGRPDVGTVVPPSTTTPHPSHLPFTGLELLPLLLLAALLLALGGVLLRSGHLPRARSVSRNVPGRT